MTTCIIAHSTRPSTRISREQAFTIGASPSLLTLLFVCSFDKSLDKDLHTSTQAQHQVQSALAPSGCCSPRVCGHPRAARTITVRICQNYLAEPTVANSTHNKTSGTAREVLDKKCALLPRSPSRCMRNTIQIEVIMHTIQREV